MEQIIRTVTGDIAPDSLGYCQCHEHVFLEKGKSFEVDPALYMDDYEKSLRELLDYKAAGGEAIVDAQPVLAGRMAEYLEKVSCDSGVKIIACTGFHKTLFYREDSYLFEQDTDAIANLYIHEIKTGMLSSELHGKQRLSCRAGIVKVALEKEGISANKTYPKLFDAAAQAVKETGAPLMMHVDKDADVLLAIEYLEKRGVPANRMIVCHLDRARYSRSYHMECASRGVFLEYDTIHRLKYHSDEKEAELIEFMLGQGFADNLLFGLDTTNLRLRNYNAPDMGLDYILKEFLPYLRKRGINEVTLDKIMKKNPKRALQQMK